MCKLKSGIVLKNRVFVPEYDNHTKMLEELGIEDNYINASKTFVRVELSPIDGNVSSDIDTWVLKSDQDIIPEWYNEKEYKPLIVEAVKKWVNSHIHIGVENLQINAGKNHYIKDCKNVRIDGSAMIAEICGFTTVEYIRGSAKVDHIVDSAVVKYIGDTAKVKYIGNLAEVKYIDNAIIVEYVDSSVMVERIGDSATIEFIGDSAKVECVGDFATIKCIYGSATIKYAEGTSTVICDKLGWKNKEKLILRDNATFKDYQTKTIYQSGDWKYVNVNQ